MAETTKEKLISSLKKLSITIPFLGVMYYLSIEKKDIDSPLKLLGSLFFGAFISFIWFLFSVIQMGGFLYWNFRSAENKGNQYKILIPVLYTMYNVIFPGITFCLRLEQFKIGFFDKYLFNKSKSLMEIFNAPSPPQGRWPDLWVWAVSCFLSIFSPIQNFTSHLGSWMNNIGVQGVLFGISLICMGYICYFSHTNKDSIDENAIGYKWYKFIVDRLSLWTDAIGSGNIKVVWPWQKNWKKKAIPWLLIVLGIITLIGVYLMYSKNYNIISIFNQNIGEGGSILTLLNVVILIFLFGSNLYYYIRDYGYCFYKNDNPPDSNHPISLMGTFVCFFYFLVTFIRYNSNENLNTELKYVLIILAIMYCLSAVAQLSIDNIIPKVSDKLGYVKDCDDSSSTTNWWKFLFGTSGTWIWLIFLLAIMLDRVIGLFSKKYSFLEIGILPLINNIIRTIMLFIANFIGFMPHWLGNINFGKL
jgi:hypothetical protein